MSLGSWNLVDAERCPGWYYGLRVRNGDGTSTFDVERASDHAAIRDLTASWYRTTEVARLMNNDYPGYEDVAVDAILRYELVNPAHPPVETKEDQ